MKQATDPESHSTGCSNPLHMFMAKLLDDSSKRRGKRRPISCLLPLSTVDTSKDKLWFVCRDYKIKRDFPLSGFMFFAIGTENSLLLPPNTPNSYRIKTYMVSRAWRKLKGEFINNSVCVCVRKNTFTLPIQSTKCLMTICNSSFPPLRFCISKSGRWKTFSHFTRQMNLRPGPSQFFWIFNHIPDCIFLHQKEIKRVMSSAKDGGGVHINVGSLCAPDPDPQLPAAGRPMAGS